MSNTTDKKECDLLEADATRKRNCETPEDEPPRKVSRASGKTLSQIDDGSMTPLHMAAWSGCVEAVRELLAAGADTRAQNSKGCTPLHTALYFMEEESAECLVDADSNINITDKDGQSPLHVAAKYGYDTIVRKLLIGGADPNPQDVKGKTPLHYAAEREFDSTVRELLYNDVHPHIIDETGKYPLDVPIILKYYKVVKIILSVYAFKDIVINWKEFNFKPRKTQYCIELLSKCYAESQRMKESKVCGCNFSYHDLASGNVIKVAQCLENKAVRDALHQDFKQDFPNYADLISYNVRKAERRKILVDQCLGCFDILSKKLPSLPRLSLDTIFVYLREQDLQNFIKAFK
ncbi:26S proteasome non-ATPase regulatory subunit 10-like [Uloborus diversus]|uniref:26S proteasome non-ATPase regulatory subunit 10-like n=1 Tax=Uloborus diversus TaxID=327109 RepID=UPI00240A4786|nr:26S proteasome non-ATPase regulatory subunit 10-like [Uloborus diversus]